MSADTQAKAEAWLSENGLYPGEFRHTPHGQALVASLTSLLERVRDAADAAARAEEKERRYEHGQCIATLRLAKLYIAGDHVDGDVMADVDTCLAQLAAPVQAQEAALITDHDWLIAHAHTVDIIVRKDGKEYRFEGDWIKPFARERHATREEPTKAQETPERVFDCGNSACNHAVCIRLRAASALASPEPEQDSEVAWQAKMEERNIGARIMVEQMRKAIESKAGRFSDEDANWIVDQALGFERGIAEGVARAATEIDHHLRHIADNAGRLKLHRGQENEARAREMGAQYLSEALEAIRSLPGARR